MKKQNIFTFWALIVITLILPILISCGTSRDFSFSWPNNYLIYGVIRDRISNQPIDSALISMTGGNVPAQVYSDSIGVYKLLLWGRGDIKGILRVTKEGYQSYEEAKTLYPTGSIDSTNIFLRPVEE